MERSILRLVEPKGLSEAYTCKVSFIEACRCPLMIETVWVPDSQVHCWGQPKSSLQALTALGREGRAETAGQACPDTLRLNIRAVQQQLHIIPTGVLCLNLSCNNLKDGVWLFTRRWVSWCILKAMRWSQNLGRQVVIRPVLGSSATCCHQVNRYCAGNLGGYFLFGVSVEGPGRFGSQIKTHP